MRRLFLRLARHFRNGRTRPDLYESRVAAVALLIDGENIAADFAVHLLAYAGKFGGVSYCRVYGNWAAPAMQRWQEMATRYGMIPKHQHLPVSGKNGTDIALVVDAMDIFYSGIRRFCLASGDSDYTPLVRRLVEQGCVVVVIGRSDTALTLQQACTVFIPIEQLQPASVRGKTPPVFVPPVSAADSNTPVDTIPTLAATVPASSENPALQALLVTAYSTIVAEKGDDWVTLAYLGTVLQRIDPNFTAKTYGTTLKGLILKHTTVFQVEEAGGGQAQIKLREQPEESNSR